MKLIERSYYLNKLQAVKDIPDIKVIAGLRRSGKSKLLDAYENILERETTNNVIKTYIQVSNDISRKETFDRELSPLLSINDAYPKMIIARTKHDETQSNGIRIIDIARWLLDK